MMCLTWARPGDAAAPADQDLPAIETHPVVPHDTAWAGGMVIGIVGFVFAAGAVGLMVRAHAPEAMPETHSHDEPPGASHHHGRGGED